MLSYDSAFISSIKLFCSKCYNPFENLLRYLKICSEHAGNWKCWNLIWNWIYIDWKPFIKNIFLSFTPGQPWRIEPMYIITFLLRNDPGRLFLNFVQCVMQCPVYIKPARQNPVKFMSRSNLSISPL